MADAPTGKPFPGVDTTFGFVFDVISEEKVEGSMAIGPEHLQPGEVVHGGVYAAFAESAASAATYFAVVDDGKTVLGMANATSLLRPASKGKLHCAAKPIHRGRTSWVWDVDFTDDDGKLCAASRVTIAVRDA